VTCSENKFANVRACELINNFCYTIGMLVEGVAIHLGQYDAGDRTSNLFYALDVSLSGLIRHRADRPDTVEMFPNYRLIKSVSEVGAGEEAELSNDHLRQVFRYTQEQMTFRMAKAQRFLREHLAELRRS
jgi:hypothetical protein